MKNRKKTKLPLIGIFWYAMAITFIFYLFDVIAPSNVAIINFGEGSIKQNEIGIVDMVVELSTYLFSFIIVFLLALFCFQIWRSQLDNRKKINLNEESHVVSISMQKIKEELDVSKDDYVRLSAYIAHEQKNIIAILRAKIQLQADDTLLADVDKMTVALDDILTLTASVEMFLENEIDLLLLCAEVIDQYKKIYPNIELVFDNSLSFIVRGRELWLERAVSNLIENAIKYGEQSRVSVELSVEKASVILAVKDGGSGFSVKDSLKIFKANYRISNIKKDGYGIGLNLVKHVCTLCQGFFLAESEEGKGAEFYMVLPVPQKAITADGEEHI
ncbi:hypothetical protein AwErysi_07080 [Erysipelotrichaceae bacterium]|nr:hypothetical protein AwErysi_07080 [Erysipelotrichaceae bacterium]